MQNLDNSFTANVQAAARAVAAEPTPGVEARLAEAGLVPAFRVFDWYKIESGDLAITRTEFLAQLWQAALAGHLTLANADMPQTFDAAARKQLERFTVNNFNLIRA